MIWKIAILFVLLSSSTTAPAQVIISGRVVDSMSRPLPFVSVVLQQDGKNMASTATTETGNFTFPLNIDGNKTCLIRISMTGYISFSKELIYPDTAFLARVILLPDKKLLSNVTVTSDRPLVTRRADRYIINVENSFLANGNSGMDVLRRSPGLWVDEQGSIRIKGTQPVTVMINDIVQRMSPDELAEYLKTLKSEDISRIEVIANPPAEYEAAGSGGIVHIILKKARRDGTTGSVVIRYIQQGKEPASGLGGNLDYKAGALYLFGGLNLGTDRNTSHITSETIFPDQVRYYGTTVRNNDNRRQGVRAGLVYDISKRQAFTIQSIVNATQMYNNFYSDISYQRPTDSTWGINTTDWIRKPIQISTNAMYTFKTDTLGSVLKVIADYTSSRREEVNVFVARSKDHTLDDDVINQTPNKTKILTIQADHSLVLRHALQLKTGLKYAGIRRDNDVRIDNIVNGAVVPNLGASNHFIYDEQLAMAYATVEKTINRTSVKLGLRFEQTFSKGNSLTSGQNFSRQYSGLFPSIFLIHNLNKKNNDALYVSYVRRLQRPGFNELNPYRLQLSTVNINVGNPNLQPQYSNNFELGCQFWKGWSASLFFSATTDIITQFAVPQGNTIEQQYLNLDKSSSYGFNLEAPLTIFRGWTMNNSISLYYADYTLGLYRNNGASFSFANSQSVHLEKIMDIDMYIQYRSPYVNANTRTSDVFYTEFGFARRIVKNKLRLRLGISDIFNATREQAKTDYNGAHTEFYQKRQTQNFGFSVSYNFSSGKKFNTKRIDQGNSEEKNRIGN
jgi:outer membrane receptor protein involved in Fe transport